MFSKYFRLNFKSILLFTLINSVFWGAEELWKNNNKHTFDTFITDLINKALIAFIGMTLALWIICTIASTWNRLFKKTDH